MEKKRWRGESFVREGREFREGGKKTSLEGNYYRHRFRGNEMVFCGVDGSKTDCSRDAELETDGMESEQG